MKQIAYRLLFVGLLVAGLLSRPAVVLAHAVVTGSDPASPCAGGEPTGGLGRCEAGAVLRAAPPAVRLWFSEPVAPVGRGITVVSPSGRPVQQGPARATGNQLAVPMAGDEAGTYLVRWQVVAADTHPARGYFTFSVGRRTAPPAADTLPVADLAAVSPGGLLLQTLARWLHFLGYALAFGPSALQVLMPAIDGVGAGAQRRLRRLTGVGIGLLLLAEPVALLAQTASLGAAFDPELITGVMSVSFGRVLALRLGGALLCWALQGALVQAGRRLLWPLPVLGVVLAAVDVGASHQIAGALPGLMPVLVTLHVAAMGAWVGGLLALLALLGAGVEEQGRLLAGFSRLAAWAVVLLGVSGAGLAAAHLAGPADLLGTPYGRALTAKLCGVAIALGLAWRGRRLARDGRPGALSWELALLGAVLTLAGLLVSLPPPR